MPAHLAGRAFEIQAWSFDRQPGFDALLSAQSDEPDEPGEPDGSGAPDA
jgi:hypothetical protein